jgi:hypothetical protein
VDYIRANHTQEFDDGQKNSYAYFPEDFRGYILVWCKNGVGISIHTGMNKAATCSLHLFLKDLYFIQINQPTRCINLSYLFPVI